MPDDVITEITVRPVMPKASLSILYPDLVDHSRTLCEQLTRSTL